MPKVCEGQKANTFIYRTFRKRNAPPQKRAKAPSGLPQAPSDGATTRNPPPEGRPPDGPENRFARTPHGIYRPFAPKAPCPWRWPAIKPPAPRKTSFGPPGPWRSFPTPPGGTPRTALDSARPGPGRDRSEEHTSELQSQFHL